MDGAIPLSAPNSSIERPAASSSTPRMIAARTSRGQDQGARRSAHQSLTGALAR